MGNKLPKMIKMPDEVDGMAVLDGVFYVLRRRDDLQVWPYKYSRKSKTYDEIGDGFITIPCMKKDSKKDMTECKSERCLFISDGDNKCIYRVEPKSKAVTKLASLSLKPEGLSMTPDGTLLVACEPDRLLELHVKTGKTIREIQLPCDIQNPKHALKRKDKEGDQFVDRYVVCHWTKDGLHRICLVNEDATCRHYFGGSIGSDKLQLKTPCYLALCENDYVLVADNDNNRLVLLDPMLEFEEIFVQDFKEPHRLYVDNEAQRVYVGDCNPVSQIKAFKMRDLPKMKPKATIDLEFDPVIKRGKGEVDGLVVVDKKLYVLRNSKEKQLCIYDVDDEEDFQYPKEQITIRDLPKGGLKDMTVCVQEKCLFICSADCKCIHKFELNSMAVNSFGKLPDSVKPRGLSITPDGALLVACEPDCLIELNVQTGKQLGAVQLPADLRYPNHAIKRQDGLYMMCHDLRRNYAMVVSSERSYHRVVVVHPDGHIRHVCGDTEGSGQWEFRKPCHLAFTENGQVLVADRGNNRLVLLTYSLQFVQYLTEQIAQPSRLFVDVDSKFFSVSKSKRLYVGSRTEAGAIRVFDMEKLD